MNNPNCIYSHQLVGGLNKEFIQKLQTCFSHSCIAIDRGIVFRAVGMQSNLFIVPDFALFVGYLIVKLVGQPLLYCYNITNIYFYNVCSTCGVCGVVVSGGGGWWGALYQFC